MDHWAFPIITGMMGCGLVFLWYINATLRQILIALRSRRDLD